MSSSSIEVMGGEDVNVMLDGNSDEAAMETLEAAEFHTLTAVEPIQYEITEQMDTDDPEMLPNSGDVAALQSDESASQTGMEGDQYEALGPPPGSIIFSPQDTMNPHISKRGRGRGRGRGSAARRTALTVRLEDGVDYSKINLPVACEICGKIMASGKVLVQHMATHLENKAFQCPHCPKSYTRMVHLQGHLVFHGIQKQFECPICHQRFSRQDCVRVHMRLHDKSKCVFCDVCHKAFLTLGALNIHMRIHRGEKPFKCHLCGKCFTQKNHVITHIKRHTKVSDAPFSKKLGPRMFQCEHCPRSFIRLSDYERHVQWNHGAVADANMLDRPKSPQDSYSAIVGAKALIPDNDFIIPETLNIKVRKKVPPIRRVMCTTGTQTDEEGGHIIIPRKYQNVACMTTTSTQVSAPPTPRATEEEMYENDIFDEGMDRNYSSEDDDDELERDENMVSHVHEIINVQHSQESSNTPNDDAFDAVLGKTKPQPEVELVKPAAEQQQSNETKSFAMDSSVSYAGRNENTHTFPSDKPREPGEIFSVAVNQIKSKDSDSSAADAALPEIRNSALKVVHTEVPTTTQNDAAPQVTRMVAAPQSTQKVVKPLFTKKLTDSLNALKTSASLKERAVEPMVRMDTSETRKPVQAPKLQTFTKIVDTFNTKNWKGSRQARGRGRGKSKSVIGLTGATHLRLIRKSMMNFISEKTEALVEMEKANQMEELPEDPLTTDMGEKKLKRQSKLKQHGKDFVCNVRSCETCNPGQERKIERVHAVESSSVPATIKDERKDYTSGTPKDQSQKLLQFLISGDVSNLDGTDFRIVNDINSLSSLGIDDRDIYTCNSAADNRENTSYANERRSMPMGDTVSFSNIQERNDFFSAVPSAVDDIISPPVELRSFCIPTYSCKLCGREFRFEGKLHRHIEAVHQNKEIFSPDVKPGRGSTKYLERDSGYIIENQDDDDDDDDDEPSPEDVNVQNPEIEALRSEWDDDDPEAEEQEQKVSGTTTVVKPAEHMVINTLQKKVHVLPKPIITKEIVPTTDVLTDVYIRGVKLNINKLSGLVGSADYIEYPYRKKINPDVTVVSSSLVNVKPTEKAVETLDTKCRKLLEKLFDHSLLIECGLFEEHVSVVLGRILQHYGVKMIEDYGQGQYEVLKYNLWRLIEWKVTMEQMEEFYTEGKSVEEMMDDIMNGRVPIIAHHEIQEAQQEQVVQTQNQVQLQDDITTSVETVQISESSLVLSQVASVLGSQLNLGDGVTQVVLAQDVSPELLQGAHIVTIDPTTGQVLSQVTADQVILADSVPEALGQQLQSIDGHVLVTQNQSVTVTSLPPGSIVADDTATIHVSESQGTSDSIGPSVTHVTIEKSQNSVRTANS